MKTKSLLSALAIARPALGPSDGPFPIFSHFCFMEDFLYAYDDVAAIIVEENTGLLGALHGDTLYGLLSNLKADEVEIAMKDGVAQLKNKSGWVKVPTLPDTEFKFHPQQEDPVCRLQITAELLTAIERCMACVDSRAATQEFSGVTISIAQGNIAFYATDDATACRYYLQQVDEAAPDFAAVIPQSSCSLLLKLADDTSVLELTERTLQMSSKDATLVSKLLPAAVDKFEAVFGAHAEGLAYFNVPAQLDSELAMAEVLLARESTNDCLVSVGAGGIRLSAAALQGTMSREIPFKLKMKDVAQIAVPPVHLRKVLPYVQVMGITHAQSAAFVGGEKNPGLVYVVSSKPLPSEARASNAADVEADIPF